MHVSLRCDSNSIRQWHLTLVERLRALPDVDVSVDARPSPAALPAAAEALFQLEKTIHGLAGLGAAGRLQPSALAGSTGARPGPVDLVIDLCGDVTSTARVWRLTYNGRSGEDALLSLILDGQTPLVRIVENDRLVIAGRLGTEYGGIAVASFEDMLHRVTTLLLAAVSGVTGGPLPELPDAGPAEPAPLSPRRLGKLAAKKLARRVVQQIYRLCYNSPHWRVGWRRLDGPDVFDLKGHPPTGWNTLADDGRRFYADPFPIVHEGRTTLFVEDFEHRLGKGIISAVSFDASGPVGRPVPVLEHSCHLSYPFVFERDGQFWMIPESCAGGTVELFRATAFPGGWVKEATLLSGVVASDATLVEKDGCWWMLATVRDGGGAFSDALHLWSAPDFRGPWTPHPRNPVLVDIASARPAGRMVWRNGALLRPVQDCRRGYGAALAIARVSRLDAAGFEQTVEAIVEPGPRWSGRRLHTLNAAGGFEFIDGSGYAPRWK